MSDGLFAGKYRVIRELGEEPSGRSFLATDARGAELVIKVVRPSSPEADAAMQRTVGLVSGIMHHALPHIVEWGHDGPDFFLVREHMIGPDLRTVVRQQGRMGTSAVARAGIDAAEALAQIHGRGALHGNVKTANLIRWSAEESVKLVDAGLGPSGDITALVAPPAPSAVAHFLAPEQVHGSELTPATDVYSLGCVLYELACGRPPIDGVNAAEVAERHILLAPTPVRQINPDISVELEAVIMRALQKVPSERYATAAALEADLQAIAATATAATAATKRRFPWGWVAVVCLLTLLCGALGLLALNPTAATVPNLQGLTQKQADAAVKKAGLKLGLVTFSGASVKGLHDGAVVEQVPATGVKLRKGAQVVLVLSGEETAQVPDVVGSAQGDAMQVLSAAGFMIGGISEVSTSAIAAGTVMSQEPSAGVSLPKGTQVTLEVAKEGPPLTETVPDVGGDSQALASTTLSAAGFAVRVTSAFSDTEATGNVITQAPAGNATAPRGAKVTITVSSGPKLITVPSVGSQTLLDAVNTLSAAGFRVDVSNTGTITTKRGLVNSQSPAANSKATAGSVVTIVVNKILVYN